MSFTGEHGRLGNQIFRNLAVSIIAKAHNLKVTYCNNDKIERLGIKLFNGDLAHPHTIELTDQNYFEVLKSDHVPFNLYSFNHFFQTPEISRFLHDYIHENMKPDIMAANKFKDRYQNNNDVFVHFRLDDCVRSAPEVEWYYKVLDSLEYDNIYISSDELSHDHVRKFINRYPKTKIIEYDEVDTIHFASTCKKVVLSFGTFGAIMGYIAFFSDIYYSTNGEHRWTYMPFWNGIQNDKCMGDQDQV